MAVIMARVLTGVVKTIIKTPLAINNFPVILLLKFLLLLNLITITSPFLAQTRLSQFIIRQFLRQCAYPHIFANKILCVGEAIK